MSITPKTVYAYDPLSHAFMRAIALDEGDLSPADLARGEAVWLIPGNCLEAQPPVAPEGHYVAEHDGAWVVKQIPPPPVESHETDETQATHAPATLERKIAELEALVEAHLDAAARAYRYQSIVAAVSYAEETAVPKFWAEGRMFRKLRSLTYAKCYEILAQFQAGEIEAPSVETLMSLLPVPDALTCAREQAELEATQAAASGEAAEG